MEGDEPYSADYLKTIHAQLTAIFNHAVNFYNLPYNPARRAGTMGNEIPKEMDFWTKEEYLKFSEAMMDKPRSFYAFEMLYWCGIRSGELLALTAADFDFQKQTVTISKTYHRSEDDTCLEEIRKRLEKKLDSLVQHELYGKYKTAPTQEEREKARREYLDRGGVPDSFRW